MAIRINFLTQFDNRGIKQAQRELAAVGRNIGRTLDLAVGGALAGATAGLVSSIKAASNYAAEFEGVNQIFGEAAKSVQAFANTAAKTAGLSATEALQASKTFGLFAKNAGLSGESAANFSTTLVQLAGDLGSFNDVPTADALAAIQSGLQGQAEPLRRFGVFLTDDALKQEYFAQTGEKVVGSLTAQQKMMASYGLIMKQTTIQQGDFTKYGDTMGNSLKTLTKSMEDLSAQLGSQLVPIIEEVLPTFQAMIPLIGTELKLAVESVDWKAFFETIAAGLTFIIQNAQAIATFIGVVWGLSKAFAAIDIAMKLAAVSFKFFTGALVLNPIGLAITAIGLLVAGVIALDDALKNIDKNALVNTSTSAATRAGQAAYDAYLRTAKREQTNTGPGSILPSEMQAAERARQAAYDKALRDAEKNITSAERLAGQIRKVEAEIVAPVFSIPEIKGSSKLSAAAKKAAAEAKKAAAEAKKAAEDHAKAVADFGDNINSAVKNLADLGQATQALGKFEQKAVDTFDSINKIVADGLKDKTIVQSAADYIYDYIKVEKVALQALARQRDVLLNKIAIAKDISAGFISAANITNTQTRQVTKSVTTMANGISTTIKTTFDEVLAGDITGAFKKIVDKTKSFAKNLVSLKKLGLNGTLFKQIVDAGAEAGGATAEAIIAGGADTVSELNSLFDELNQAGSDIAKESTDTFYSLGEGVSNAFIDGLKSQEQALAEQIASMVASIEEAFATMLANLDKLKAGQMTVKASSLDTFEYARILAGTGNPLSAEDVRFAQIGQRAGATVNVTVNAGLGTNGKAVGQQIQSLLNQYAKASG